MVVTTAKQYGTYEYVHLIKWKYEYYIIILYSFELGVEKLNRVVYDVPYVFVYLCKMSPQNNTSQLYLSCIGLMVSTFLFPFFFLNTHTDPYAEQLSFWPQNFPPISFLFLLFPPLCYLPLRSASSALLSQKEISLGVAGGTRTTPLPLLFLSFMG